MAKREEAIEPLVSTIGVECEQAAKWIGDVNSIAAIILDNKARLDYIPTAVEGVSAFRSNPEYGGSIDMSTICAKRRLAWGPGNQIKKDLPPVMSRVQVLLSWGGASRSRWGAGDACGVIRLPGRSFRG